MMNMRNQTRSPRTQGGVYAIEFAFVFLITFALVYIVICYGLLLTMRLGIQNAAEDGARAGLRYQLTQGERETEAGDVAEQHSNWLPNTLKANRDIEATVCTAVGNNCEGTVVCGPEWASRCQIVVTITVGELGQFLPPFPGFALPDRIVGKAGMLLDGRSS